MNRISAILLAAGMSQRMQGPNKLLMLVNGTSMVVQSYQQLEASGVAEIIVVTGRDREQVEALLSPFSPNLVHNSEFELGMTTSIQKGVAQATGDAYMICLADMPWLTGKHYQDLMTHFDTALSSNNAPIVVPMVNGKRGNPVIFSSRYKGAILAHQDMTGCKAIVKDNLQHKVEYITDDVSYITDIDTPEEYDKLTQ